MTCLREDTCKASMRPNLHTDVATAPKPPIRGAEYTGSTRPKRHLFAQRRNQCSTQGIKICAVLLQSSYNASLCRVNPLASEDLRKGVVADSALYDLVPPFDTIWMLPIDVFHIAFEGITKTMLNRMFVLRCTRESRAVLMQINYLYKKMRVFSETARSSRTIRPAQLKGSELAVVTFTVFITLALQVLNAMDNHWYNFVAMLVKCIF